MTSTTTTSVVRRRPDDVTRRILCVLLITCSCFVTDCSPSDVNQRRHPSVDDAGDDAGDDDGCSSVKAAYASKGFDDQDVPQQMITGGHHLIICKQQTTCCTRDMEDNLRLKTSHDISHLIMQKLSDYRQDFVTHLIKFDEYFLALIDQSHADLHDIFLRTYGRTYEQNVQIFVDLFRDIRSFYRRRTSSVDIEDVLDRFFGQLMRRIFSLLNGDRHFGDGFFACIGEHLDRLRPFGDIPLKLRLQMTRSFGAARAFVDGLGTGRDVILAMSKLDYSVDCLNELMKLTYCSYCQGLTDIKPCTDYCLDVFRDCVGYYSNINRLWNAYLGEMITLASRLDGPFNVEMVVSPLGIKLSEAVMVFQENFDSFSAKVFLGCDDSNKSQHRPSDSRNGTRRRREDESTKSSLDFEFASTPSPNPHPMQENFSNHSIFGSVKVNVSQLVHDVLGRLDAMRDIWRNLPELLCNETSLADLDEATACWNGSSALRKSGDDDGNDNLHVDEKAARSHVKHSNVIEKELIELHLAISRIKNAHSGINEDIADSDDDLSGSGDESGSGTDDLEDDQLQTTKVIYIDLVSSSQMVTEEARVAAASTSQPQTISTASDARIHFLTCLSWMVSAWTVIFTAEMNRFLQF